MNKLRGLVRELIGVGAMLPGSVSHQFNVCGMPGCRCKDKKNPQKHGPYPKLSYGAKGKSSSMFVKEADAERVGKMTENYKRIRDLTVEIGFAMVALCREKGVDEAAGIYDEITRQEKVRSCGGKLTPQARKRTGEGKWREKALARGSMLDKKRVEARDVRTSRDKWREEALALRKRSADLEDRLEALEKKKSQGDRELKKKRR